MGDPGGDASWVLRGAHGDRDADRRIARREWGTLMSKRRRGVLSVSVSERRLRSSWAICAASSSLMHQATWNWPRLRMTTMQWVIGPVTTRQLVRWAARSLSYAGSETCTSTVSLTSVGSETASRSSVSNSVVLWPCTSSRPSSLACSIAKRTHEDGWIDKGRRDGRRGGSRARATRRAVTRRRPG